MIRYYLKLALWYVVRGLAWLWESEDDGVPNGVWLAGAAAIAYSMAWVAGGVIAVMREGFLNVPMETGWSAAVWYPLYGISAVGVIAGVCLSARQAGRGIKAVAAAPKPEPPVTIAEKIAAGAGSLSEPDDQRGRLRIVERK